MNPLVGEALSANYNVAMIAWSYVFSVIGSFLALECARLIRRSDGTLDSTMLFTAGLMLGGIGIWTMHFIGMQAYRLAVPIGYDGLLTLLSLVAAIAISSLALYLAGGSGRFSVKGWLFAGLVAGVGVCVMHYLGMFAMVMRAQMTLDMRIVGWSLLIAVAAALAALWLAFNVPNRLLRGVAALVMGAAVCTMHYTGMSAASMVCTAAAPSSTFLIAGRDIPYWTFFVASAVIAAGFYQLVSRTISAGVRPSATAMRRPA